MQTRPFGRTGRTVSRLGFGAMRLPADEVDGKRVLRRAEAIALLHRAWRAGVSYVDSAWSYDDGQSEEVVGEALAAWDGPAPTVVTKSPLWLIKKEGDFRRFLEQQLTRLKRSRIDVYLFHGNAVRWRDQVIRPFRLVEQARQAVAEGLIGHLGFSSHDSADFVNATIDEGWAEMVLVQYNLLDRRYEPAIRHAAALGLGVAVMGPVGGGRLGVHSDVLKAMMPAGTATSAELALRWVLANPDVTLALSGMSTPAQVDENVAIAARPEALTADERARVDRALAEVRRLADLYCTGCRYCLPCPQGVDIPGNFAIASHKRVYGLVDHAAKAWAEMPAKKRASACTACGACEPKCPQKIEIRRQLREMAAEFGGAG